MFFRNRCYKFKYSCLKLNYICQFFINVKDNVFLDHRSPDPRGFGYAVFGTVTKGTNVVDKIAKVKTGNVGFFGDVPVEPVVIEKVTIAEKAAAAAPQK